MRPLATLFIMLAGLLLVGCGAATPRAEFVLDRAWDLYFENPTARAAFKANREQQFREEDKALCGRDTGEKHLTCVGDPKALPPS